MNILPRHLLYLDGDGLLAFRGAHGRIALEGDFRPGEQHFSAYLGQNRGASFLLLVDLPDESFQTVSLPFARGRDRRALIARLQERLFPATPFVTHRSLGRDPEGRRDERLLFHALTRPLAIQLWLDEIRHAGARLSGVHASAALAEELARHIAAPAAACLLASRSRAGLRVSCIAGGRLRFSRLSAVASATLAGLAPRIAEELRGMREHLITQHAVSRTAPLPLHVLAHPDEYRATSLGVDADICLLDLARVAQRCGLRPLPVDSDSLALHVHLALQARRLAQFAPAQAGARSCLPAWALGSAACIALALHTQADTRRLEDMRASKSATLRQIEDQLARRVTPPVLPADLAPALRSLAAQRRAAEWPAPIVAPLSRLLDAHPQLSLDSLEWSVAGTMAELHIELRLADELATQPRELARLCSAVLAELARSPGFRVRAEKLPPAVDSTQPLALRATDPTPPEALRLLIHIAVAR